MDSLRYFEQTSLKALSVRIMLSSLFLNVSIMPVAKVSSLLKGISLPV